MQPKTGEPGMGKRQTAERESMPVLSVHLATRSWADLGVALLGLGLPIAGASTVSCEILPWREADAPTVVELAERLDWICHERGVRVLMLDGPQAWKADDNGFAHSRTAERVLHTAAKMGRPGTVLPGTYERFVGYCLALYDALARLGWQRLMAGQAGSPARSRAESSAGQRFLVESYPHAAWKSLGILPLPARRRCRVSDLARAWADLSAVVPIYASQPPNHNQMQAIVGGLPGLALAADLSGERAGESAAAQTDSERGGDFRRAGRPADPPPMVGSRIVGQPPRQVDGHWREGFIAVPVAPAASSIRWNRE